jgi:uncharacterized protein
MTWQVVNLAEAAPTPWKNGGGTTRELIAWPDAEHWVWRMSVAEVAQSGPFSRYDGVQRWFAVLGGAGVALTHNGMRHVLTVDSAPFCFDGGLPTACDLIDGATQDFNLMTRMAGDTVEEAVAAPALASATMARVRGEASIKVSVLPNTTKIVAAYAMCTRAAARFNGENTSILPRSLVWRTVAAHDVIQIAAEDALLIEVEVVQNSVRPAIPVAPTHAATGLGSAS